MSLSGESSADLGRDGVFQRHRSPPQVCPTRGLNGLLDVHPEINNVSQDLRHGQGLLIGPGAAHDDVGLSVFQDHGRLDSVKASLVRFVAVDVRGIQGEVPATVLKKDPGVTRHQPGAPGVAKAVDEGD